MHEEPEWLGDTAFFDLVEMPILAGSSLEAVSGMERRSGYQSGLAQRVEAAWQAPFEALSCNDVRTLMNQKMGVQWLGRPVVSFVTRYPGSECTYYPGDMLTSMLHAAEDFARHVQPEFGIWLRQDFGWLEPIFGWDESLYRKVLADLERARRFA